MSYFHLDDHRRTDLFRFRSNVIWAADTNYRISLPNEEARRLAEQDDYASLLAADQVSDSRLPRRHSLTCHSDSSAK